MTDTHTTAQIPDEAVQAKRHLIQSYNWSFKSTGIDVIDDILSSIADAAESYHNTSQWEDEGHIERIQKYADIAADHLSSPCAVEVPTKEERHANTSRNLIINQTSTDLEQIINGHDPEQSILNNDVWDRLDKMACEIEALAKPVDVAAVRRQAFEEAKQAIAHMPLGYNEDVMNGEENAYRAIEALSSCATDVSEEFSGSVDTDTALEAAAREAGWALMELVDTIDWKKRSHVSQIITNLGIALSAEPAQGEQWQPIETAPKDGARFLATLSNGWIVILSETGQDRYAWYQTSSKIHIPVARTHPRDSLKESILATHWMPLPAAPTTEAGK